MALILDLVNVILNIVAHEEGLQDVIFTKRQCSHMGHGMDQPNTNGLLNVLM